MDYQKFCEVMEDKVRNKLIQQGNDVKVSLIELPKNNGNVVGLQINNNTLVKERVVSPVIRLDGAYEKFKKGVRISTLVERISDSYDREKDRLREIDKINLHDLDKIYYTVVNSNMNEEFLETVVHENRGEFSLVARSLVEEKDESIGSFVIKKDMVEALNLSSDEIMKRAKENTPKLFPVTFKSSFDITMDLLLSTDDLENHSNELIMNSPNPFELYVLTNDKGINGASVMFYDGVLEEIANSAQDNLIILPSSIHEVLILKENGMSMGELADLAEMIQSINGKEVAPEEVLGVEPAVYMKDIQQLMTLKDLVNPTLTQKRRN